MHASNFGDFTHTLTVDSTLVPLQVVYVQHVEHVDFLNHRPVRGYVQDWSSQIGASMPGKPLECCSAVRRSDWIVPGIQNDPSSARAIA